MSRWLIGLLAAAAAIICPDTRATGYFDTSTRARYSSMPAGSSAGVPKKMSVCELHDLHQYCVDKINYYRASRPAFSDGRSPTFTPPGNLQLLDTPFLQCHNEKAMSDLVKDKSGSGCGHWTAGFSCPFVPTALGSAGTENSCCRRACTTLANCKSVLDGCLAQMWDEGIKVLNGVTDFSQIGHYVNMIGSSSYLTCGFGFDDADNVYMTQNFYGAGSANTPCAYNCLTAQSKAQECQSQYASCYGVQYCSSAGQCTTPPVCYSAAGSCTNGQCAYTTPTPSCQAGTCNAAHQCVQQCFDTNCAHCTTTLQGGCDTCTTGIVKSSLQNGCCVQDCVVVGGSSYSGTYLAAGFSSSGQISYYSTATGKYLAFYCCGWGWAITTAIDSGSVWQYSSFTTGDARASSGRWSGYPAVTVTGCYAACQPPTPACNTPPPCYSGPGTCGACGCTYTPMAAGSACAGGTCDAGGLCVQGTSTICPVLNPPAGATGAACSNVQVAGTCTFACATGYTATGGNAVRTCGAGGVWGGTALVCTQTCPTLSSPPNAVVASCANFVPPAVCTFACASGFPLDNGFLQRTCTAGSPPAWSGQALSCNAVATCPNLAPPANAGGATCSGQTSGTCTFTCSTGFQVRAGTDATRTCAAGAWGGVTLICDPIPCPTITSPTLAVTASCAGKVNGDTCQFACVYGAMVSAGTTVRTCSAGTWTPATALVCAWTVCPTISSPTNAVATTCANQIHNSTCAFTCNPGFSPAGQTYTCNNGAWNPAGALTCTALVCPDLVAPSGANAASCTGKTQGFVCTFSCAGNNVPSGSASRTCTNGAWDGTLFACSAPAQCPTLTAPTGSSSAACTAFISGQVCTQTCDSGFTQAGGPRTCTPPTWGGTPVTCTPKVCPNATGPPNTVAANCVGKTEGQTCTYVCDVGWTGSWTQTCTSGAWVGTVGFCTAKLCPDLTPPLNSASLPCQGQVHQSTCTMGCGIGYAPKTLTRTCYDGAWTGNALVCTQLVCPDLLAPASATGTACTGKTQGAVCTFACQPTFTSNGMESRTCSDGAWSGSALTCTAANRCPDLNSPTGAVTQVCSNKVAGDTCTFACGVGFKVGTGDTSRVCGTDGLWAGVTLRCDAKLCPTLISPTGAAVANCTNYAQASVCTFQCLTGYSGNGFEARTCNDGAWSGSSLVCAPMPCPDLISPSGAKPPATCVGKVEGDTCSFTCDPATTTTIGDPVRICRSGSWTGAQLQCPLNTLRYQFSAGDWGLCPVTCGSAFQTRVVTCVDTTNASVVDPAMCAPQHPIDSVQTCPNPATVCPTYNWTTGPWDACSKVCGSGVNTRSVVCNVSFAGTPGGTVPDIDCATLGPKPATTQPCNTQPCVAGTFNWVTLPWSACTTTCGPGTQTRVVQCQDSNSNVVQDTMCTTMKPVVSQTCNVGDCKSYFWQVCNFTECTASCDTSMQAQQFRDVWCASKDTGNGAQVADESFCLAVGAKPSAMLTGCNIFPCQDFNWMTSLWSTCDNGVKTRTVHCHAANGMNAQNSQCNPALQPILTMPCKPFTCDSEPPRPPTTGGAAALFVGVVPVFLLIASV